MNEMGLRYIVYCRKSTESEDRQILSLSAQKRELDQVVARDHLRVVGEYSESGSAYKVGRSGFSEMIQRIQDGEADAILTWAYNRLARNPLDGGMVVYLLDSGVLKAIKTPSGYTDGSGNSKFMLQMEFAMSKKSSDDNSESVKRGNREKILRGWPIKKHAGYMFVEEPTTGEKLLRKDPERFDLVQKAMHLVIEGKTPPAAMEILNNEWGYRTPKTRKLGGKPMSMSNFYNILHDEFYVGWLYTDDGQRVKGKYESMLSEVEYARLQMVLGNGGHVRPKYLELPYRGLMVCGECGSAICLEEKYQIICTGCKFKFSYKNRGDCPKCRLEIINMENPTRLHYIYGRCTKKKDKNCSQKTIRVDRLEEQIKDYLMSLHISPRVHEWVLGQLKKNTTSQVAINAQALENLQKVVTGAQRELDSLLVQYTQPENADRSIISTNAYMKRKSELESGKKQAESKLADLSQRVKNFMQDTEERFDFAVTAAERFEQGGYETRTEVFRNLGSNLKLLDRKVLMTEDNLDIFIRKANNEIRTLTVDPLEPEKSIDEYDKTGVVSPVISVLQGY